HLVDEYTYTFQLDDSLLERAGVTRDALAKAFIEHDVVQRGLDAAGTGDYVLARRFLRFGQATYSRELARNPKGALLRILLALGPLGRPLAAQARKQLRARRPQQVRPLEPGRA